MTHKRSERQPEKDSRKDSHPRDVQAGLDYKTSQLCRQAEDAIVLALGASADPALRDLMVAAVRPVRGSACLEVVVHPEDPTAHLGWLEEKLGRAKGYLRGELAEVIHRKRIPDLCFVVLPAVDPDTKP